MTTDKAARGGVMPVLLMFALFLLTAVIIAAVCCASLNAASEHTFALRTAFNYTQNKLRASEEVYIDGGALALTDGMGGVSYIYCDGENLLEAYTDVDTPFDAAEYGEIICACDEFHAELSGGTLKLTFDIGGERITTAAATEREIVLRGMA